MSATRDKIAKLARRHLELSAYEEQPLDAVRLALVKESHLGTLVNLRT